MCQKIVRIIAIFFAGVFTLSLLLGFSYLYKKYFYTQPISSVLSQIPAVKSFNLENYPQKTKIGIQFSSEEQLRKSFYVFFEKLEGKYKNSLDKVTVEINNDPDEALESFLRKARFPIYEAISTGKYSMLNDSLSLLEQQHQVTYDLEIDDNFIFLTVCKNESSANMILKRQEFPLEIINKIGGEYL